MAATPPYTAWQPNSKDASVEYVPYNDNVWQTIVTKVIPLFNGEGIKGSIEDLNELVRQWLRDTPPQTVINEINELLSTGNVALGAKLNSVPDEVLATRVAEAWSFYFGTVLPYFQGVFLPVRLLTRIQTRNGVEPPDVRGLALVSFREHVLLPRAGRLEDTLPRLFADIESNRRVSDTLSRFMQMLSIIQQVSLDERQKSRVLDLLTLLKRHAALTAHA
ncbi:HbrB-like-domain-containing protein [Cladochytrium replicatum]|nr:HbrB-like-domain-containing protein [Cladochytrium replicatum]